MQTRHTFHFGNSDLVISEDFKTVISDFQNDFEHFLQYFTSRKSEDNEKIEQDLTAMFIKQKEINLRQDSNLNKHSA